MALKVIIPPGLTEVTVNGLHQWDYGREIEIHADNLPALVEVHFACAGMETAVVRNCAAIDGVVTAAVPDICLEQTTPIVAWVYDAGGTSGKTILTIKLPVTQRTKPQPRESIPEKTSDKYTEAIAAMNEVVGKLKNGQISVKKADEAGHAAEADEAGHAAEAGHATTASQDKEGQPLKGLLRCNSDDFTIYGDDDKLEGGLLLIRSASATNGIGGTSVFIAETGVAGYAGAQYSSVYYDGNYETNLWPARLKFTPCDGNQFFTITPQRYTDGAWKDFSGAYASYKPVIGYQYLVRYSNNNGGGEA